MIIIITIFALIVVWWFVWRDSQAKKNALIEEQKSLYEVWFWDIQSEVKVSATASLVNEQNLSFGQPWKITTVFVWVWDQVSAWEVLAELDMDEYSNTIQSAQLDVENAQLSLNKLLNNDTSLTEAQIQSQLNESRNSYQNELDQLSLLQEQVQVSLQQKNDQLEQLNREFEIAKKSLTVSWSWIVMNIKSETEQTQNALESRQQTIRSLVNTLRTVEWDIENVLESIDRIFWVSETFQNDADSYSQYLSVRNTWLRFRVESTVRQWYTLLEKISETIRTVDTSNSDEEITQAIDIIYDESEFYRELADVALDALDMTTVWNQFTQWQLQWFIGTVTSARSQINWIRSQLQWLTSSVNTLLSDEVQEWQLQISTDQKQLDLERQQIALTKLQEDIALLQSDILLLKRDSSNQVVRKESQIDVLQDRVPLLEKELDELRDWPDEYDIQQARNMIRQSQLRLERTRDQKDNYQVIAEFDGRVRTVDIVAWEQFELEDRKFIVIENPDLIELKLQVGQIDIVKMNEWNSVEITFDAYPNDRVDAKITTLSSNPQANGRWWISYEATIVLEKQNKKILAWMTALVTVITAQSDNVLIVPSLAIVQKNEKQFVQKKQWDEYVLTKVDIWVTNNFQVEITSWLIEWDVIKSSALDDQALQDMWIDESSASPFGRRR